MCIIMNVSMSSMYLFLSRVSACVRMHLYVRMQVFGAFGVALVCRLAS